MWRVIARLLWFVSGLVVACGLLAGAYFGLSHWKKAREAAPAGSSAPPATPVAACPAACGPLPVYLDAIGSLKAARQVVVAPEAGGTVTAIHFESGGAVKKGDPLVQLNDAPERGDLERFNGVLVQADREYRRVADTVRAGVGSRSDADLAQSRLAEVKGQIARTEALIAQKKVTAPFAGVLGVRKVNLGDYLQPGQAVVTLTDLDTLHVDFTLPEQAVPLLRVGFPVEITVDAFRGRVFPAKVTTLEPQVYAESRTALVQGTLDNPGHLLRPGMFAAVRVVLPPEPDVVTVPETALDRSVAGDSVYVVRATDGGRAVERVAVKAGRRVGGRVVILDGVTGGELVVTSGQINLAPGSPVTVVPNTLDAGREPNTGGSRP